MTSPFFLRLFLVAFALCLCMSASAQTAVKPAKKLKTLSFTCRVVYEPSNAMWVRELEVDYDSKAFKVLRIDGIQAHGFSVEGASIITHMDNERIYLDLSVPSWKSQFREAAQGQGVCIKNR
ncbi:hypothetical protein [Variovorax sp. PCZ-1]|uniref:hypothetical protein n=1 Tax=Variovorax sp. PCZ-1 TaxID=2835533 RepID=UPI001BCD3949|nr:hypothetical protein [Variovorax sp. PCZ-1]MBS7807052.1 hypothetical protein [Variovorax sp. PCZ-1]